MFGKVTKLQSSNMAGLSAACRLTVIAFVLVNQLGFATAPLAAATTTTEIQSGKHVPAALTCEPEIYHGLQHCSENGVHLLRIDLSDPHVRLQTVLSANDGGECNSVNPVSKDGTSNCPNPYPFETLASMLQRYRTQGAVAAINTDYFGCGGAFPCGGSSGDHGAQGLAVRNGVRLDGTAHGVNNSYATDLPSLAVSPLNAISIGIPGSGANIEGQLDNRYYNTVAGSPLLVQNGAVISNPCSQPYHAPYGETCDSSGDQGGGGIEAQSAAALTADSTTLFLATGNLTAEALASYLVSQAPAVANNSAITSAIKFDGGGSARLEWLDSTGTIQHYSPTGEDRPIAEALLVFSDKIATEAPGISPAILSLPLNPGQSYSTKLTVSTGVSPIDRGDVMFVFDRTGSMEQEIEIAKSTAQSIMNEVLTKVPNTWFGVAGFMDYPGNYEYPGYTDPGNRPYGESSDVPWELNLNPTEDIIQVSAIIKDTILLGSGADGPESYSRMLYELRSVGWRADAKKIAVVFGDAPAHDLDFGSQNYGGDPGPDGIAQTADDLDFETVVQQLRDASVTVIAVNSQLDPAYAEATFKGMSIGFGTAVGTRGQYYVLTDTAQLPLMTANLILAENSSVDALSLRVTEGYEDWIRYTPNIVEHVGGNAAKDFQLTVTTPAGTPPGFYPFLIQAIGDGSILGAMPVEIIVPSPTPTNDLGFRPNPDGYGVAAAPSQQSWEMFRQLFGTNQVEYSNSHRIHAADVFYQQVFANAGANGSHTGAALTSIFNYLPATVQSNAGSFAIPKTTNLFGQTLLPPQLSDAIAFAQGLPLSLEIGYHKATLCELTEKSPAAIFFLLQSQMQQGSPSLISLANMEPVAAAGTPQEVILLPYRIVTSTGGTTNQADVFVYDPEFPGDANRRITFTWNADRSTDSWSYMGMLQGDKRLCQLVATPLNRFTHTGIAWWKAAPNWPPPVTSAGVKASMILTETPPSVQLYSVTGAASLLFSDDTGRRIGWEGTAFYDEIPGASFLPIAGAKHLQEGLFYLPMDAALSIQLNAVAAGDAAVDIFGEGYLLQISVQSILSGTVANLKVNTQGEMIALSAQTNVLSGTVAISRLFDGEDRTVRVEQLHLQAGDSATLDFRPALTSEEQDEILLQTHSNNTQSLALSLQRTGESSSYSVLGTEGITLNSDYQLEIRVADWADLEATTLVKKDSTGTVVETVSISNNVTPTTILLESQIVKLMKSEDSMPLNVAIYDQYGAYVADGTPVTFATNLGTISQAITPTMGGRATVAYTRGKESGDVAITIQSGGAQAVVNLHLDEPTALPDGDEPSAPEHRIFLPFVHR